MDLPRTFSFTALDWDDFLKGDSHQEVESSDSGEQLSSLVEKLCDLLLEGLPPTRS